MRFPTLYKTTSTGKIQTWTIGVEGYPYGHHDHMELDPADIVTTYGLLDGKQQEARETISEGKNIGKVNETTPFEQATAEAQSQWEKKVKKGYVQTLEDAADKKVDSAYVAGGIDPMLAHTHEKQSAKIVYPAFVQPKLDGHRCIAIYADGVCTLWSRTRKLITGVPHIARAVEALLEGIDFNQPIILDGELYNHDYKDRFEQLTSFIRQETPKPGHEVVQLWIYDIVTEGTFAQRNAMLDLLRQKDEDLLLRDTLVFVDSYNVDDEQEMSDTFGVFLSEGFEGLMIRNANGKYKHGRSYDLQKVKTFDDAEFKVVGVEEGRGKMAGKAMFVCDSGNGETFRVKMVGNLDALADYLVDPSRWIGQQLTVKYQGMSAYGQPRFPVALRFREDV